jgi:hypothetical protein
MWKALIIGAALGATVAFAQAPTNTTEQKVGPNGDPNQVICRTEGEIGSRLSRRRICRTRSEWAELEQQTRQTVDRTQTYRPSCENGRC